jgi:hypothetical protein
MTLRLQGTTGFTEVKAPAAAGSNTLTLPTSNGSAGQVLKNGSTAGTLEFGSAMPTDSVLQVKSVYNNTHYTGTALTFADLFSASITPSATTSKILVIAQLAISKADNYTGLGRMVRQIGSGSFTAFGGGVGTETNHEDNIWWSIRNTIYGVSPYTVLYLDSPSTTSAVTYKAQFRTTITSHGWAVNRTLSNENYDWQSPAASSITLMEVAG